MKRSARRAFPNPVAGGIPREIGTNGHHNGHHEKSAR
jgi:hypothetical protein